MKITDNQIKEYVAASKFLNEKSQNIIKKRNIGYINKINDFQYNSVIIEGNLEFEVGINKKNLERSKCNCQMNASYGKCQHILALALSIKEKDDILASNASDLNELVNYNFMHFFDYDSKNYKIVNLRPKFFINEESDLFDIDLIIKFENEREYIVKDIDKTINKLKNNGSLEIVSKMKLKKNEYQINQRTEKLINILNLNSNINNENNYGNTKNRVSLSKIEIIEIFKLFIDDIIEVNFKEYYVTEKPLPIILNIYDQDNQIKINFNQNLEVKEIIKNKIFLFDKNLYLLNDVQTNLYNTLKPVINNQVKEISLDLKYFEKFFLNSKNKLENLFEINYSPKFQVPVLKEDLKTIINISKIDSNKVRIDLAFIYGEIQYGYDLFTNNKTLQLVEHQVEVENSILDILNPSKNKLHPTNQTELGYIEADNNKYIYDLFKYKIKQLKELATVNVNDSLSGKIINSKNSLISIDLDFKEDNSFFEINYDIKTFEKEDLSNIIKSIESEEKFHIIKNGNYLSLDDNDLVEQIKILHLIESEWKEGSNLIPLYRLFGLKNIIEKYFTNISIEKELDFYLDKLNNINQKEYSLENVKLRDYQVQGINWIQSLYEFNLGGLLGDEMGLGKTLQVLTFLSENPNLNVLIVVPKALIYNWGEEIKRFFPKMDFQIINGNKENRLKIISKGNKEIKITSYNMLRLDIDYYKNKFDVVIIDEAQHIKNPTIKISKAVKKIDANFKLALTGTPIENNVLDLWSIFDYCLPKYLLSKQKFKKNYIDRNDYDLLKYQINPFLLRRTKKEYLKDLPEKIETPVYCELTQKQKEIYKQYVGEYQNEVIDLFDENDYKESQLHVLKLLMRLRQITCHPKLVSETYTGDSGKLDLLIELIEENKENGNRILVFSQFVSFLSIVKESLVENDINFSYLDGKTSSKNRIKLVDEFNNSDIDVFLISLKAGGVGLNLTGASTVIHLDPWWNPSVENQASDRVHRIGQKKVVQVNKLITKNTIEEKIYKLQRKKNNLTDNVLDIDSKLIHDLSKEELIDLFSFDESIN